MTAKLRHIDLLNLQRDTKAESEFEWSAIAFAFLFGTLLGLGIMIWAMTTDRGFGAEFFTGLVLMFTAAFGGLAYSQGATRFCSECGREAEKFTADLDKENSSGSLIGMIGTRYVNGRAYIRNPNSDDSTSDFQSRWARGACVVAVCHHCNRYTVVTQVVSLPLDDQDQFNLLEMETGCKVT